jgi:hypothetical protein
VRGHAKASSAESTLGRGSLGRIAAAMLVVALTLLAVAPSAMGALTTRLQTASFGPDGTSTSSFSDAGRLAFNQTSNTLYVLDNGGSQIHAFDTPALTPLGGAFPLSVSGAGFGTNGDIAVDNTLGASANNIYYVASQLARIYGYTSGGSELGGFPLEDPAATCGGAVDSAGRLAVGKRAPVGEKIVNEVKKYNSTGGVTGTTDVSAEGDVCKIAFDSNDDMFIAGGGSSERTGLWKYTAASGYANATKITPVTPNAIAVDKTTHTLYVAFSSRVSAYSTNGTFLYDFSSGGRGVTVDEGSDQVYVSASDEVQVFAPAQSYDDATGAPIAATNVDYFSADVSATIDDNNALPTRWRLELSNDGGVTWKTIDTGSTAGNEVGSVVSGTATGLSINTEYKFRVVTNKGVDASSEVPSASLSFKTPNPPSATAVPAAPTNITDASADLSAVVTDNGPLPTNWRFELSSNDGLTWDIAASGVTTGKAATVASTGTSTGTLTVKADGGTFTLAFQGETTPPLVYNASAAAVQAALEGLPTIGAGNVEVGDGPGSPSGSNPYSLAFTGALDGTAVTEIGADASELHNPAATVSAIAKDLIPNSNYTFRVVTNKGPGASEVTSDVLAFTTLSVPPLVTDVGAVEIDDTSARLIGTANPRHSATNYVFQYGTTPSFGSSTEPLALGDGNTPITLSQVVQGLLPDTTYYFNLTATNVFGTTESATATLHTRAVPMPLPESRGWEQVSPVDKNYGDADSGYGLLKAGVSLNGDGVGYCPSNQFGDPPGRMTYTCTPYISRRGPGGWQTPNDFPLFCKVDPSSGNEEGGMGVYPSSDFSRVLFLKPESEGCSIPPLDPAAPLLPGDPAFNLYLQDPTTNPSSYDLLNSQTIKEFRSQMYAGGSNDFSHVVYQSYRANQTAPPDSPPEGPFKKLYDWEQEGEGDCAQPGGCLTLISKDTNGEPFETASTMPTAGPNRGLDIVLASAVSDDGERIFFANPNADNSGNSSACVNPGCQIYMREHAATTYDVSASECTVTCGSPQEKADYFLSATPSGEQAFFSSCAKLTDDSSPEATCVSPKQNGSGLGEVGSKLYRWDRNGAPGGKLVDLTVDHEPEDGSQPDFLGLVGNSDNGDVAYFATGGQIVTGAPTGSGAKLYRWRWNGGSPLVDYLGPFEPLSGRWEMNMLQQNRLVTPGGGDLMVFTKLRLDPAGDGDGDVDVYHWDEADGWACVSCQLPGVPSNGNVDLPAVWLDYYTFFFPESGLLEPRIYMSDDGQHIFFGTPDALVPADTNGEAGCPIESELSEIVEVDIYSCEDVYEWHDGTVSLVSGGTSSEATRLIGSDTSGNNVFFFTRQSLVGWDVDDNVDIYDARVGGGFPEPPAQPPACEGEACRGTGTTAPNVPGAGTAAFDGPGNPRPAPGCRKGQVRKKGKCVAKPRRKHHKRTHHRPANDNRRIGR